MTQESSKQDLVVLVADKNMESVMKGLLGRPKAFKMRELAWVCYVHPEKDPGCFLRGHDFLRHFSNQFTHALVLFDREGCGKEKYPREDIEKEVESRLSQSGWVNRAAAIAIDPELEIWVWSDSPHVESVLGWKSNDSQMNLRRWLEEKGLFAENRNKPDMPKEAMEETLKFAHKPRSSSLYLQLADKVSIARCADPSFIKLKRVLHGWFYK